MEAEPIKQCKGRLTRKTNFPALKGIKDVRIIIKEDKIEFYHQADENRLKEKNYIAKINFYQILAVQFGPLLSFNGVILNLKEFNTVVIEFKDFTISAETGDLINNLLEAFKKKSFDFTDEDGVLMECFLEKNNEHLFQVNSLWLPRNVRVLNNFELQYFEEKKYKGKIDFRKVEKFTVEKLGNRYYLTFITKIKKYKFRTSSKETTKNLSEIVRNMLNRANESEKQGMKKEKENRLSFSKKVFNVAKESNFMKNKSRIVSVGIGKKVDKTTTELILRHYNYSETANENDKERSRKLADLNELFNKSAKTRLFVYYQNNVFDYYDFHGMTLKGSIKLNKTFKISFIDYLGYIFMYTSDRTWIIKLNTQCNEKKPQKKFVDKFKREHPFSDYFVIKKEIQSRNLFILNLRNSRSFLKHIEHVKAPDINLIITSPVKKLGHSDKESLKSKWQFRVLSLYTDGILDYYKITSEEKIAGRIDLFKEIIKEEKTTENSNVIFYGNELTFSVKTRNRTYKFKTFKNIDLEFWKYSLDMLLGKNHISSIFSAKKSIETSNLDEEAEEQENSDETIFSVECMFLKLDEESRNEFGVLNLNSDGNLELYSSNFWITRSYEKEIAKSKNIQIKNKYIVRLQKIVLENTTLVFEYKEQEMYSTLKISKRNVDLKLYLFSLEQLVVLENMIKNRFYNRLSGLLTNSAEINKSTKAEKEELTTSVFNLPLTSENFGEIVKENYKAIEDISDLIMRKSLNVKRSFTYEPLICCFQCKELSYFYSKKNLGTKFYFLTNEKYFYLVAISVENRLFQKIAEIPKKSINKIHFFVPKDQKDKIEKATQFGGLSKSFQKNFLTVFVDSKEYLVLLFQEQEIFNFLVDFLKHIQFDLEKSENPPSELVVLDKDEREKVEFKEFLSSVFYLPYFILNNSPKRDENSHAILESIFNLNKGSFLNVKVELEKVEASLAVKVRFFVTQFQSLCEKENYSEELENLFNSESVKNNLFNMEKEEINGYLNKLKELTFENISHSKSMTEIESVFILVLKLVFYISFCSLQSRENIYYLKNAIENNNKNLDTSNFYNLECINFFFSNFLNTFFKHVAVLIYQSNNFDEMFGVIKKAKTLVFVLCEPLILSKILVDHSEKIQNFKASFDSQIVSSVSQSIVIQKFLAKEQNQKDLETLKKFIVNFRVLIGLFNKKENKEQIKELNFSLISVLLEDYDKNVSLVLKIINKENWESPKNEVASVDIIFNYITNTLFFYKICLINFQNLKLYYETTFKYLITYLKGVYAFFAKFTEKSRNLKNSLSYDPKNTAFFYSSEEAQLKPVFEEIINNLFFYAKLFMIIERKAAVFINEINFEVGDFSEKELEKVFKTFSKFKNSVVNNVRKFKQLTYLNIFDILLMFNVEFIDYVLKAENTEIKTKFDLQKVFDNILDLSSLKELDIIRESKIFNKIQPNSVVLLEKFFNTLLGQKNFFNEEEKRSVLSFFWESNLAVIEGFLLPTLSSVYLSNSKVAILFIIFAYLIDPLKTFFTIKDLEKEFKTQKRYLSIKKLLGLYNLNKKQLEDCLSNNQEEKTTRLIQFLKNKSVN